MRRIQDTHVFPVSPERLMQLIDEDTYRNFFAANMPNLVAYERLEFRWEGDKRIRRVRLSFDTPVPALLKRALPARGQGWVEEHNVLYPKERRMESRMTSSATESVRVVHFRDAPVTGHTERHTETTFRATVPVVRGALERFMEHEAQKHRNTEYEITLRYLREHLGMNV